MAKQKLNLTKLRGLKSQLCVRKTFSASFVPQPAENHTYTVHILSTPAVASLDMRSKNTGTESTLKNKV